MSGSSRIVLIAPLRHRAFRLLFAGQTISDLGDWLDILALIALITYRWELGASALAALSVAMAVPRVALVPVAGLLADRWPRRRLLVGCDVARGILVLGLVWAPDLPTALTLVLLRSGFSTLFGPARQAALRATVPPNDLLAAGSLGHLSTQATKVVGPAIGGVLLVLVGPRGAFIADSISFAASALILAQLPDSLDRPAPGIASSGMGRGFQAGLRYIATRRTLLTAVLGMAAALFLIFLFDSLGALALRDIGLGESWLGLAVGGVGLGTAVGAVVIGQWGGRVHPFGIMGTGQVLTGILVAGLGVIVSLGVNATNPAWLIAWLLMGLVAAAMFVPYGFILQSQTPPELMGRVAAAASAVQTLCQLAAPPLGAALAEVCGLGVVFTAAGSGLAVVGLAVLLGRPRLATSPETSAA